MHTLPLYPTASLAVENLQPIPLDKSCTRCALSTGVRTVCMAAELSGPTNGPTLLVVGEGPGENEDRQGRPFVGASGTVLRGALGLWKGPVVIENALRCAPGSREIKPSYIEACRPYLAGTFQETKPARILALGATAATAVLGHGISPFSTRKGYGYTASGVPVFFVLHPAAALRNRFVRSWFDADIKWALTASPPMPPPTGGTVYIVTTPEESLAACQEMRTAEWASLDVETFGIVHEPGYHLLGLSLTARQESEEGVAYVWGRAELEDSAVNAPLKAYLQDPRAKKIGSNAKYDAHAIEYGLGVRVRGWAGDVRLWRKLLQADAHADLETMQYLVGMGGGKADIEPLIDSAKKNLQKLSLQYSKGKLSLEAVQIAPSVRCMAMSDADVDRMLRAIHHGTGPKTYAFAALPNDLRNSYNARDTVSTARLGRKLESELRANPELWGVWQNVVAPLSHAVERMEWNGIGVSKPAIYQLQAAMAAKEAELSARLKPYGDLNPNSSKDVAELVYGQLNTPVTHVTPGGKPSTAAEVLEGIDHPVVKDLIAYRQCTKFKSQYADGMEFYIRSDGRIHPSILLDGTECMPAGELVLTARGYLPVEQVRVGDTVLTHEGRPRKVVERSEFAPAPIYHVVLSNGTHLRTTANHQYRAGAGWQRADSLKVGTSVAVHSGGEVWETIDGWAPFEVSTWGRVRNAHTGHVLTLQSKGRWGHLKVTLKRGGARTRGADRRDFGVHRLVLETFAPERTGPIAMHLDGYAWNNTLENLAWGDHRTNFADARKHGSMSHRHAGHSQVALTPAVADAIRATPLAVASNQALADRFGVSRALVRGVRNGTRWQPEAHVAGKRASFGEATVVLVEVLPAAPTYGLTVEEDASHVTGGIVTHNTGRPSSREPNLMNIPRPKTAEGKMCRDIFVAPPGHLLLEGDYSQIELRVAAMLSQDPAMIEVFREAHRAPEEEKGKYDFHLQTAKMVAPVLGYKPEDITKEHPLRDQAKIINFGVLYGKVAAGLSAELGISKAKAQALIDAIFGKFKRLHQWIQESLAFARRTGYCRTWWAGSDARIRPLWRVGDADEEARSNAERSSWNTRIQGTATEFTNASLGAFQRWLDEDGIPARLVLTVYDSILVEVREQDVAEVAWNLKRIMCGWESWGVPVEAEFKVGAAWGSMQGLKVS